MTLNKNANFSTYLNLEKEKIYPTAVLNDFWLAIISTYEKRFNIRVHGYIVCDSHARHLESTDTSYSYHLASDVPFHHYLENTQRNNLHIFYDKGTRELYLQYKVYDSDVNALHTYVTPIYLVTDTKFKKYQAHIHLQNLKPLLKNVTKYKLPKSIALNYYFKF